MAKVSVLGSGSWGTAMAMCLANNGHNILVWCRSDETANQLKKTHINEKYLPGVVLPENINSKYTNVNKQK